MVQRMERLAGYHSLVPLLLRIGVGLTFFFSGLGKVLGGTEQVAGFFGSLGIPLAGLMGPFVAYLELLGGLALILGLFTRVFAVLFIGVMLVALITVNLPAFAGEPSVAQGFSKVRVELLLLLASACLTILGAGRDAIDALLLGRRARPIEAAAREPAH